MKVSWIYPNRVEESKGGFLSHVDEVVEPESLTQLAEFMTLTHFAPGVFVENRKRQSHLHSIELVAFDFDDGKLTSKAVAHQLNGEQFIIVGSKNHLKDKGDGKGIIERFHVFVPTDVPITSVEFYKYVSKKYASLKKWNVDTSCLEPARYFYQHSQVLFVSQDGTRISVDRFQRMQSLENRIREQRERYFAEHRPKTEETPATDKFLRTKYAAMLKEELSGGDGRYAKRCKIIGGMKACGVAIDQAITLFNEFGGFGGKFTETTLRNMY